LQALSTTIQPSELEQLTLFVPSDYHFNREIPPAREFFLNAGIPLGVGILLDKGILIW